MDDIQIMLKKALVDLLLDHPFYGNLALHLPLQEDSSIPTFATDYKKIYYNKDFVKKLSRQDIRFILAHEICHVVFLHNLRMQSREQERWNFAADYAINAILKKEFNHMPTGGLYLQKFENMTAEAIYNQLPEINGKGKQSGGDRRHQKGDVTIDIDKDGNIKVNGEDVKPFDVHKPFQGSKEEAEEMEKEWKVQVSKAYTQAKMAGKLPAGMDIFIEQLLEPKLDWRNMLRQFVIQNAKSDYNWFPPSRRHLHNDMYMPSLTDESLGDVVVIVDNSGSCIPDQQRFFSECNGLLQQYEVDMHLIVADTEVNSYRVYNQGDKIDLKQKGGGGTNLPIAFDYIATKRINPSVVVCLTDGYTPWPKKEKHPTLWVLSKDSIDIKDVPFGMKVKMND